MVKQFLVLHLGSNIDDRFMYLNSALQLLEYEFGKPLKKSSIYQTKAWGNSGQPDFLNVAAIYKTGILPHQVLEIIKNFEIKTGRKPRGHWNEREIDIDVIFYGNEIINEEDLIIPHQRIQDRKFVLVPLKEICPEYMHPVLKLTISELLNKCTDNLKVEKWKNA